MLLLQFLLSWRVFSYHRSFHLYGYVFVSRVLVAVSLHADVFHSKFQQSNAYSSVLMV